MCVCGGGGGVVRDVVRFAKKQLSIFQNSQYPCRLAAVGSHVSEATRLRSPGRKWAGISQDLGQSEENHSDPHMDVRYTCRQVHTPTTVNRCCYM